MSDQELHLRKLIENLERENAALKESIERHGNANDQLVIENKKLKANQELLLDKLHDIAICADKKWIEKEVFEVEQMIKENK